MPLSASNTVTVKHVPLTHIESPTWQSPRMGPDSLKVIVQPSVRVGKEIDATRDVCSIYIRGQLRIHVAAPAAPASIDLQYR